MPWYHVRSSCSSVPHPIEHSRRCLVSQAYGEDRFQLGARGPGYRRAKILLNWRACQLQVVTPSACFEIRRGELAIAIGRWQCLSTVSYCCPHTAWSEKRSYRRVRLQSNEGLDHSCPKYSSSVSGHCHMSLLDYVLHHHPSYYHL